MPVAGPASPGATPSRPFDGPFRWLVGIEDTFIPQPARSTGRILDEYELTGHYDAWRDDLDLIHALGVRDIRYGIPWYRVNPEPGRFDWSWTDRVLEHMVGRLGISPVIDLMHYGCPPWLERQFVDLDYAARVAEYAAAFVERYRTMTHAYTPLNEPLVTARFCGFTAQWPPYVRGWRGWVRVALAVADGMQRTVAAIRELRPAASVVHVEATSWIEAHDPALADELHSARLRQFLPTDLFLGRVDERHPLRRWLAVHGAADEELDRIRSSGQRFDVFGVNFYPHLSCHRLVSRDGRAIGRRFHGGAPQLAGTVRAFQGRYGTPVMISETSTHGPVPRRDRWMRESIAAVAALRDDGVPVVGYTWWPLFSLVAWSFRRGRKDTGEYLIHMGLFDLEPGDDGRLLRRPTALVDRFRSAVAGTL